uniref:protein-tyrosine-phosphatase n=1 Tax=Crassostrea virginica TaxID=6565 RepID=A0A8B8ASU8_CRAVI|nr:phosphatidylinositol phosphatase PTPRQ-like isoform X3 [Crassostrea virginica]
MEKPLYLLILLIMLNRNGGSFNTVNAISVSSNTGITETKNVVLSTVSSTDLETESQLNSNTKDEPKEELTPMPTVSESLTPSKETLLSETRGPSLSEGLMTLEALAPSYKMLESLAPTVNKGSTTSLASSSATVEALAPTSSNCSTTLGAMAPTATTGSVISEAVASPTPTLEALEPLSSKESTISEGMSHSSSKGSTQDLPSVLSDGSATSEAVAPSKGPTISKELLSTPSRGFMISEALVPIPSKVLTISEGIVSTPSKGPIMMEGLVSTPSKGPAISEGLVSTPSKVPAISEGLVSTPNKAPEISEGLVSTPSKGPMMMEGLVSTPSKGPAISEGLVSTPSKDLSEALNFTPSMGLAISESLVLTPSKKQKALAFTLSKDPLMSEGFVSTQGKGPMISEALISTPSKGLSEAFVSTTSKDFTISEALVSTPSSVPMISEARVTSLSNDATISEAPVPISSKDTTISQTLATASYKDTMSFSEAFEPLSSKESTISEELVVTKSKGLAISEAPVSGPTILKRLVSTPRRGFTISEALPSKVPTISEGIVSTPSKGPMMSERLVSSPSIDLSEELVSFPSKGLAISEALVSTPSKDLTVSEARVSTQNKGPTVSEELSPTSSKDTTVSDALVSSFMTSDALETTTSKAYLTLEKLAFTSSKVTSPSEALATTPSFNDNLSRIPRSTDLGKSTLTTTTSKSKRDLVATTPSTMQDVPVCHEEELKNLSKVKSTNVVLNFTQLYANNKGENLCVKFQSDWTNVTCELLKDSILRYDNLTSSQRYTISVFAFNNETGTPVFGSPLCQITVYTLPNDPICHQKEPVVSENRTSTTITLGLASLYKNNGEGNFCVMTEPSTVKSSCRPFIASTVIFNNLEPSNQYNFSVFSFHNTSGNPMYSSLSCQISEYTLPNGPICQQKEPVVLENRTSTTITLGLAPLYEGKEEHFCVRTEPRTFNSTCRPFIASTVIFNNLKPSNQYNFSVFSYHNTSGNPMYSSSSCQISEYTLPNDPICQQKEPVVLENRTSTTLTLGLAPLYKGKEEHFCVRTEPRTVNSTCRPFIASTVIFNNLKPSNQYNFSVFSYHNTSGNPLYSDLSCQISRYTLPRNPPCTKERPILSNRTAKIIYLDLSQIVSYTYPSAFCVKVQPNTDNAGCTTVVNSTFSIKNLATSTQYNFSVFTYVIELGKLLLSASSCSLSVYTLPQLDCQRINLTSVGLVVPKEAAHNIDQLNLTIQHSGKVENIIYSTTSNETYSFPTIGGRVYTVKVVGRGLDGSWTPQPCTKTFSTPLRPPNCSANALRIGTTEIQVNLGECSFQNGTNFVQILHNGDNITAELQENISLTGLTAGQLTNFSLLAYGEKGIYSRFNYFEYTDPEVPVPDNIIQNVTELQIKWIKPPGVVKYYNITTNCSCNCNPIVIHTGDETKALVTGLMAGTHCSVKITAVSGGRYSRPLIYEDIETLEIKSEKVTNVDIREVTTTGFQLSWSAPNTTNGDLINYNVNISNATFLHDLNVSLSSTEVQVTNLNAGMCYNVTIAAVNKAGEGQIEIRSVYTLEKVPSSVTNLTAFNTSSTSIAVAWSKPLEPNGVITKYEIDVVPSETEKCTRRFVLYCVDCHRNCPNVFDSTDQYSEVDEVEKVPDKNVCTMATLNITANNDAFKYEVSGLEKFTVYKIHVKASTAIGSGQDATKEVKTSEDKPTSPGRPYAIDVKSRRMNFMYNKSDHEYGIITHQEIEYTHLPYDVCAADTGTTMSVVETETLPVNIFDERFSFSLRKLEPFWEYSIRVRVSTSAGFSNFSENITIRTQSDTPDPVTDIAVRSNTSRSLMLSWTQPCHPNGIITNYRIEVQNFNDSLDNQRTYINNNTLNTNNNNTRFNVTNLLPYRFYVFTVYTEVEANSSVPTTSAPFQTDIEAPYAPGSITLDNITSSSVQVKWKPPSFQTGPTKYEVVATDKRNTSKSCSTQGFMNTSCEIIGLHAYWDYTIAVRVFTDSFTPNQSTAVLKTDQSAPGRVALFIVTQNPNITAKTSVRIQWKPPIESDLNGIIQKYFILYGYQRGQNKTMAYDDTLRETKIEVEAEKNYTFQIFAMTIENATVDDYYKQDITIKPGAPLPPPKQNTTLIMNSSPASDDQTQINVAFSHLAMCDDSNGRITKWYIIVSKGSGKKAFRGGRKQYSSFIERNYKTWKEVYDTDNNVPYIASDSWKPSCSNGARRRRSVQKIFTFTLGMEGECDNGKKYCNGNLEPGETYRVRYSLCTDGGCLESEFSEPFKTAPNLTPAIAGTTTAVILLVFVIIIVIIVIKRRGMGPFKKEHGEDAGHPNEAFSGVEMKVNTPKAVKIAEFANYVQKMHADSNLLFSSEYKTLKETCPTHPTKAAEVQVNRIKNRYTNILAYDHSRVKLLPTEDDEGSDYINANYIQGFNSQREYIATQGPLPFTRDDFWRMIWEQNVSIIVMLTQLVERGRRKCDMYWPEASREPVYYGDLIVELESESTLPDYVLRVMSVKLGDTRKIVKQFSFLAWPDMGIPETSETMLKFAKDVRGHAPLPVSDRGPIVIHCSAGVGRTGTFIAVDYLMQFVRTSDVIDIYSYVMKMRNNRPNMVQTEDQYVFIHDCLKDFVNQNSEDDDEEEETPEDQTIYENV